MTRYTFAVFAALLFTLPHGAHAGIKQQIATAAVAGLASAIMDDDPAQKSNIDKLEVDNHATFGNIEVEAGVLRLNEVSLKGLKSTTTKINLKTDVTGKVEVKDGWLDMNMVKASGRVDDMDIDQSVTVKGDVTCRWAYCSIGKTQVK